MPATDPFLARPPFTSASPSRLLLTSLSLVTFLALAGQTTSSKAALSDAVTVTITPNPNTVPVVPAYSPNSVLVDEGDRPGPYTLLSLSDYQFFHKDEGGPLDLLPKAGYVLFLDPNGRTQSDWLAWDGVTEQFSFASAERPGLPTPPTGLNQLGTVVEGSAPAEVSGFFWSSDAVTKYGLSILVTSAEEAAVPEPASFVVWSLLGVVGLSVGWWRRRRAA